MDVRVESAVCRGVAGIEDDADCRRSEGQPGSEEGEDGVWLIGTVVLLEEEEEGTGPGCRPKCWAKTTAMNHAEREKDDATGSVTFREDRHDGFVQSSKRKTCKRLEKTDGTTNASPKVDWRLRR